MADSINITMTNTSGTELYTGGLQESMCARVWGPEGINSNQANKKVVKLTQSFCSMEGKYHIYVGEGFSPKQHVSEIKVTKTSGTCHITVNTDGVQSVTGTACEKV